MNSEEFQAILSETAWDFTLLQEAMIQSLEDDLLGGNARVMDPSLPIVNLFESSVMLSANLFNEDFIYSRGAYPVISTGTEAELYNWMSNKDYVGNYASPADHSFIILIDRDEITQRAVRIGTTNTRMLQIKKNTNIVVNGLTFTMQYPINIIVKSHGDLEIVYDLSTVSPLQQMKGNKVDWRMIRLNSGESIKTMVEMTVPIKQMKLVTQLAEVSDSKIFKKTFTFEDQFHYLMAYRRIGTDQWVPMDTTASDQVFDPFKPTVLFRVIENTVEVTLPYVYVTSGQVGSNIRLDIYSTKGEVLMDISSLTTDAYTATFVDPDNTDNNLYSSPIDVMRTFQVTTSSIGQGGLISGGSNAPSLAQRRNRVLTNSLGDASPPMTDDQIQSQLTSLGFDAIMNLDLLPYRSYLTVRSLPKPTLGNSMTGVSSAIVKLQYSFTELMEYDTVIRNNDRLTILPDTLYQDNEGEITIVPDAVRLLLDTMAPEMVANALSVNRYLTTPFHYVLDPTGNKFEVRPYYLQAPSVDVSSYANSNNSLGLTVISSTDFGIEPVAQGYRILLATESNDAWKALRDDQVHVQLAFTPTGEDTLAFLNGTLLQTLDTGERVFEFIIQTRFDVNQDHSLITTNFAMLDPAPRALPTTLNTEFYLFWAVSDYTSPGMETSDIDTMMGRYLLPSDAIGVYQESVDVSLGQELSGLWRASIAVAGDLPVKVYEEDVYDTYPSNIYEYVDGKPVIVVIDGVEQIKKLHRKGDVILDDEGKPKVLHSKGSTVLDEEGNPVITGERDIIRWWDVSMIDAVYRYATNTDDQTYYRSIPTVISYWINNILKSFGPEFREQTEVYFQPRDTLLYVDTVVDNNERKRLYTAQRLEVDLIVTKDVLQNLDLTASMKAATRKAIVASLDTTEVANLDLRNAVKDVLGDDVITVVVRGLGGEDYQVITLLEPSSRLVLNKVLSKEGDGKLTVVDDITVNVRLHNASS